MESSRLFHEEQKECYNGTRRTNEYAKRKERKSKKGVFQKNKKASWNRILQQNTCAVSLVRHSGPFLKWTIAKHMDHRAMKLIMIDKTVHLNDHN